MHPPQNLIVLLLKTMTVGDLQNQLMMIGGKISSISISRIVGILLKIRDNRVVLTGILEKKGIWMSGKKIDKSSVQLSSVS